MLKTLNRIGLRTRLAGTVLIGFGLLAVAAGLTLVHVVDTAGDAKETARVRAAARQAQHHVDRTRQAMMHAATRAAERLASGGEAGSDPADGVVAILLDAVVSSGASRAWVVAGDGSASIAVGGSAVATQAEQALAKKVSTGAAAAMLSVSDGRASWIVTARVGARAPVVGIDMPIDDAFAERLAERFGADVALALRSGKGGTTLGASAAARSNQELLALAGRFPAQESLAGRVDERPAVGLPVERNGSARVVAVLLLPSAEIAGLRSRLASDLGLVGIAVGAAMLILLFHTGGAVAATVNRLTAASRQLMQGRFEKPVLSSRADEIGRLVSTFNVMAEAVVQRERRVRDIAFRDPVTGLPTRILFEERVSKLIASWRNSGRSGAALVVFIDGLTDLSDTLGREAVETIVAALAERFRKVVRSQSFALGEGAEEDAAPPDVARIAAGEFALVIADCDHARARKLALRLVDMVGKPFRHDSQSLSLGGRVGIALFPDHGLVLDELLHAADLAGRAAVDEVTRIAVYDTEHERDREAQLAMLSELRKALERREVTLVFQPKVPLGGESNILRAEVLMRWQHPERGVQNPADFVKFAERTGFISKLTMFAIDGALRHVADWAKAGVSLEVAVNLTPRDLANSELPTYVVERLRHYGLPGSSLTVEVPESALVSDDPVSARNVVLIDRIGVRIAVDNFGTAFAAIDRLRRLPIDYLKIDRRHVAAMVQEASSRVVVKAAVDVAHALGLTAIAEGVEGPRELSLLRRMGCDEAQGYYLGRPLNREDFAAWVRHQAARFGVRPGEEAPKGSTVPSPAKVRDSAVGG